MTTAAWSCTPRICTSGAWTGTRWSWTARRRAHPGRAAARRSTRISVRWCTDKAQGRNGIVVWKADDVSVENLTVCNFLGGAGDSGNEIWWNGGDGSGKIGLTGYHGRYLTGTSTYFSGESTAAAVRHLRVERTRTGQLGPDLRQQHERLGHVRRCLPAALRGHHRPRLDGEQRAGLLGDQLRGRHRDRELGVRPQRGRPRHEHPDRRRPPAAAGRGLPRRGDQPHHPHALVLGVHAQRRPRQQQPRRPRGGRTPRPAPSAPA